MPASTAGSFIARVLQNYGVRCVFGMEDPVHISHALDRSRVRLVTIHDEKHGAIMAHGYAKATGRPGICLATCGPGATNLITGLLEAQKSSIPVIAFVQDIALKNRDRHAASEIDHATCMAPYAKWVARIELADRAVEMVHHAFRIATSGRPGPVVVLCPPDVMAQEVAFLDDDLAADAAYMSYPSCRTRPSAEAIRKAADLIAAARRPIILAGGGVMLSRAWNEVVELAEMLRAPVATTMNGKGAIADDHPLSAGVAGTTTGGRYGRGMIANTLLEEADLTLIVGSRNGQICSFNWTLPRRGTTILHIDIDPVEIGRNMRVTQALPGDAKETVQDLIAALQGRSVAGEDRTRRLQELRLQWDSETRDVFSSQAKPIRPERLLREISGRVQRDATIVADASYTTGWAMSHIDTPGQGNAMISPRGTGGIGWSLPAAIGAKLADPSRKVVCIAGDGAFSYVMNEIETAARYRVTVAIVVFNNRTLGFQRHYEQKLFNTYRECDFLDIDFATIARGMQCQAERIEDPALLGAALDRALAADGPYLLDVLIDPDAMAPIVGLEREQVMESH